MKKKLRWKGLDRKAIRKAAMHPLPTLLMAKVSERCECYKEYKPGMVLPMDNVLLMLCAKCGKSLNPFI